MSMHTCTSSQAYDEQPFALALTLVQHITIILSRSIVVERNIKLADIYDPTFEGRTFLKVVKHGLPVDMASYIYQSVRAMALKTDAQISLPHGILLTQFHHALLVPEGAYELRAVPLGSINKTTLSKSMAQTRRALHAARVATDKGAPSKSSEVLKLTDDDEE
ncbi:hypothetical protein CJ030_MR1G014120 [Morella rubra]|uniref:Uncharacterized protein n=1 Tax=Morella rubra TaxID=262757 RepID=A0A6A1WP18_9ROSI|nr:hypothetical protein CJ030_MR1G014120 [Morella rubra]